MDRTDEERDLARLAKRIADGQRVDWEREVLDASVTPDQVRHLRLVEQISDEHRRLLEEDVPFDSWGPLDLKRAIASGGFGDVFQARDRNLDRDVALKLFVESDDSRAPEAFVDEARRLATVRHENVVTVHGVDRHEGRTGLWMDWIDGETLETLADESGPMAAAEAARIGVELCRALAAIHAAGLVHRDVKLSNVMRERGGRIVLMDFGSSTRVADGEGPLIGTPIYLAPEVFEGADSGKLVDIYALGVVLYRLVSDGFPVEFDAASEMRRKHREGDVVPLRDRNPNLPAEFVRVVERAIHPDPERRFGSAGEMERALNEVLAPTTVIGPPKRPAWKQAPVWAALVLLATIATAWVAHRLVTEPFEPGVELYRYSPEEGEIRLVSGMRIRTGEQMFLEFDADRPTWFYVINVDAAGEQNLLFPVDGLATDNPVPEGRHKIPGAVGDERQYWNVTSAGGSDLLMVVASAHAVEEIEEKIAGLRPVTPGGPLRIEQDDVAGELRGIAGMSPAPMGGDRIDSPLVDEIRGGVSQRSGGDRGVRVWEWTLSNPE